MTSTPRSAALPAPPRLGKRLQRLLGLWLLSCLVWTLGHAAEAIKKSFDLPADAVEKSLKRFSVQSGLQVLFPTDAVAGVRTQAVRGEMTSRQALDAMLAGTGFDAFQDPKSGALTVKRHAPPNGAPPAPGNERSRDSFKKKEDGTTSNPPPMKRKPLITQLAAIVALFAGAPAHAQETGAVTGRILNEGTGQYLRSAVVSVAGTNLSTLAEAGGVYVLTGVPAGPARITVSYAGLEPAEAAVTVVAGGTVTRDFTMSAATDSAIVKMGKFVVVTEREGNFKAIQDQKTALEIKSVVATDAFGDVSEGNVGEFLKLMPGVMMDYVDADVRAVSIGGLDPKYAVIMMDGAPVASASSANIATGRTFEFEQLSITSIEAVELSKTPTPDVAGSALAGVVNLRSKGAFDRKGRQIRWAASAGLNSHHFTLKRTPGPADTKTFKLQPNASIEFSDVLFDNRLGVLAGFNHARTLVEQNFITYNYAFNASAADNATEVPRISQIQLQDAPKVTSRTNYNLRLDYKFSPELTAWARGEHNTYAARNFQRSVTFNLANAINGPAASDPRTAGVEYSLSSQTATSVQAGMGTDSFIKHGATTTFGSGASFTRGAFRADVQGQVSISKSRNEDLGYGFFVATGTGLSSPFSLRWDRAGAGDAGVNLTQLSGADWQNPATYPNPASLSARVPITAGKDQKWTAKADFRYNWNRLRLPILFKWGGDISEQVRDVNRPAPLNFTYLGPDGIARTGDEYVPIEPHYRLRNLGGGNLQNLPSPDRFLMAREYGAHPERYTAPTAAQVLRNVLTTHWDVKEQIDSLYLQGIVKITKKLDVAPGVRLERLRSSARGPTDRGDDYAKRVLTGDPNANVSTESLDYIQARYGSDATNSSAYHTWLKYLHATYRFTPDLVLRASFNDSITRPPLDNLAGGITINPDANPPTARIPNPQLQPERGRNLFVSAEYYFPKHAGFFTVSGSRRDISNLIRSNIFDVPLGGSYENREGLDLGGYRITTSENVGKAHVLSGEVSYRQNLVFLPGFWRRLSLFGNYTRLHYDDYENFRRPQNLVNGGVSFDHRGLSLRWNFIWVPIFRRAALPANGWIAMEGERLTHDVQFGYRISSRLTMFVNGRNVFNRPQRNYWGPSRSDILFRHFDFGGIWTAGVRGQF